MTATIRPGTSSPPRVTARPRWIGDRVDAARAPSTNAELRLERLPSLDGIAPVVAAEAFRDLPGLVLLESGRAGRRARWSYLTAGPRSVIDRPALGPDPFASARRELASLARSQWLCGDRVADGGANRPAGRAAADPAIDPGCLPPFTGGLIGYLAYEFGRSLERLPASSPDDQGLPVLRLAVHDWVIAWDHRTGRAWLGGRAVHGDRPELDRRLAVVRDRLAGLPSPRYGSDPNGTGSGPAAVPRPLVFVSNMTPADHRDGVERVRAAIASGQIYQANLARRLEAPFRSDPWPLYRALRSGDPAQFSTYLDIGVDGALGASRAIVSASPEPFLAVDRNGHVATDPIKGTRPRGRTADEDRALAADLMASAKDRAENVMIVDVLRNDLGRVCRPGSVRVPRLCRLERTTTVQHLVSTVTGRLAPGRDAFDLLAAAFPGGSITGAPKIRAMEILDGLEPVRRGPYTGAALWMGPDGAMGSSILIRTFVADGHRLTLHVGGGITWRSDPGAEWDETTAKARGPLGAIGATELTAGPQAWRR